MRKTVPAIAVLLLPLVCQAAPGQDEQWETTMSMETEGMTMPPMTQTVCTPKGAKTENRMLDRNCRMLDSKQSGNKSTFRFACEEGADKWTGTGEMERIGSDAYRGTMNASGTRDGQPFTMKMNVSGKRKGTCTYEDPRRKVDELMAQRQAMMAKECDGMIEQLQPGVFFGGNGLPDDALVCKDRQADFCAKVASVTAGMRDVNGYTAAKEKYGDTWREAAKACGTDPASVTGPLCGSAVTGRNWQFLAANCPDEAATLRKENCTGRTYTSVAADFRELCAAVGGLSYTAQRPSTSNTDTTDTGKGLTDKLKEGAGKLRKFLKF
ncbi:MAG: DUF3617 family protein [Betaproteobacteria bacterium]|nr:DUF3617 family protein [Betaproteobacteria bacterium]